MMFRYLIPVLALGFAACETVPPEPVIVEMPQEGFDEVMRRAAANPSPASVDRALSELLARTDLTEDQRVDALYLRAEKRWRGKFNVPGAVADYDQFLALRPLDARAADAKRHSGFARSDVRAAESRLRSLQNITNWFNDKVTMGGLPEAAARYQRSRLTPTEQQVYTLREAGYICAGGSAGQRVHNYGAAPSYVSGLVWCGGSVS
jgi:hypothetical protein